MTDISQPAANSLPNKKLLRPARVRRKERYKKRLRNLTTVEVISSLRPWAMTPQRRLRACRKLALRMRAGVGLPPLYIWLMWRHGYDSDAYMHRAYHGAEAVGVASAIMGLVTAFDGNVDTNINLDVKGWPFWLVTAGVFGAVTAWRLNQYTRQEVEKIREYMRVFNEKGETKYLDSLVKDGRIDKPAQAMLLGRGIHDVGYKMLAQLGVEEREARIEGAVQKTDVDQMPSTVRPDDLKQLLNLWFLFSGLTSLARRAGLAPAYSKSGRHVTERYEKPIRAALENLFVRAERPDLIEQLDGAHCRAYRHRVPCGASKNGFGPAPA